MIGILSDAHGNIKSFQKGVELLRQKGAERLLFLGDAIGYIPSLEVLTEITQLSDKIECILGNHESLVLGHNFDDKKEQVYQHKKIHAALSQRPELVRTLDKWKTHRIHHFPIGKCLFIHGSPKNYTYGYIQPDTDLKEFETDANYVFMGHTHRPFTRQHNNTTYVNVGSCGLPRDQGHLGSCALFNELTGDIQILRFDIREYIENCIENYPTIHKSVKQLLARKSQELIGEVID